MLLIGIKIYFLVGKGGFNELMIKAIVSLIKKSRELLIVIVND